MRMPLEKNDLGKIILPKVTIIYDNYLYKEGLATAWGFSCLIKSAKNTILFDTGGDGIVLLENMAKLGIDPMTIDQVVISHQHWDHIGGIYHFLNQQPEVRINVPGSFSELFKQDLQRYECKLIEVKAPAQLCDFAYSSGDMGGRIPEQALFLDTTKGTIIITGCAHPGIIDIIRKGQDLLKKDIICVLGGFHLRAKPTSFIKEIISDFKRLGVKYAGPCHCSGDATRAMFENAYQKDYLDVGSGRIITMQDMP